MGKKLAQKILSLVLLLSVTVPAFAAGATALTPEEIYRQASPAVFYLRALQADGGVKTYGTGFLVASDGLAVTAAHVVTGAAALEAELDNGITVSGVQVVSSDAVSDLAVLRLPSTVAKGAAGCDALAAWYAEHPKDMVTRQQQSYQLKYPLIKVAQSAPTYGASVYGIGYASRAGRVITDGIVASPSFILNNNARMLVTPTLFNGMSGGPLIDDGGVAIGVISGTIKTMSDIGFSPLTTNVWDAVNAAKE